MTNYVILAPDTSMYAAGILCNQTEKPIGRMKLAQKVYLLAYLN